MDKLDFEKYKKEKIEYDKKIRELDYEIVKKSVELSNLLNKSKILNNSDNFNNKEFDLEKLKNDIQKIENDKKKYTNETYEKLQTVKNDLNEIINKEVSKNNENRDKYIKFSTTLDSIRDVHFDIEIISNILNFINDTTDNSQNIDKNNNMYNKNEYINNSMKNIEVERKINIENKIVNNNLDIPKQRIIDFENLLKHTFKISKGYRSSIEKIISEYISNYGILKNSEILQSEYEKNKELATNSFTSTIKKFEKNEKVHELEIKIQELIENNKRAKQDIQNTISQSEDMKQKVEKMQEIYLVQGYAKKILKKFLKAQADTENRENLITKNEDKVFKKVKSISYDYRLKHIIEVSKWTKNVETKLKRYKLDEDDLGYIIYIIRQTENICNLNYETITNSIISLCDNCIELEQIEEANKIYKQILEQDLSISKILKEGIDTIRKKYSKIPFIGRKIAYALEIKTLNS